MDVAGAAPTFRNLTELKQREPWTRYETQLPLLAFLSRRLIMKREKRHSTLHRKKNPVFKECVMCHRLVEASEIKYLKVQIPTGQYVRAQVCKLCIVDSNKTRFYIQQQLRKKKWPAAKAARRRENSTRSL
jgi:hypothetical protein